MALLSSRSITSAGLFILVEMPPWLLTVWGVLDSRWRSIFTSRDLRGCSTASHGEVFSWRSDLWGSFVPLWHISVLGLLWIGGTGSRLWFWSGFWEKQEQEFGLRPPHDIQWLVTTSGTSNPDFCSSFFECLVLFLSLLEPLLSFLEHPNFVFTLGFPVKQESFVWVFKTSALLASDVAAAWSRKRACIECFLEVLQFLELPGREFLLLCGRHRLFWRLSWQGTTGLSGNSLWWDESSSILFLEFWESRLWEGLWETSGSPWPSLLEFCWLDRIQFPSCQLVRLAPGGSGCWKRERWFSKWSVTWIT